MAASSIQNPSAVVASKKKKTKEPRTESPAPTQTASDRANSVSPLEANSDEPVFIREIAKNIRNVNKKITNASKTDGLIIENKDKSLDELVALKIINADQKAQHLKKPALLAQLAQLEEQLAQLKKIDSDYRQRLTSDKAEVTKTLTEKFDKEMAEAVRAAKKQGAEAAKKQLHDALLTVSQFLRLAAARRADDQNPQLDENLALEGVLLQVYSGDENGVSTMLKLVEGSQETTKSVANEPLETTFAQVKAASAAIAAPLLPTEDASPETAETHEVQSDPTLTHASLTEIDAGTDTVYTAAAQENGVAQTNGHVEPETAAEAETSGQIIANASVADSAANAAGESQWDVPSAAASGHVKDLSMSQEWVDVSHVEVPRDPAETETGLEATPADGGNKQSWADEQPESPPEPPKAVVANPEVNDGFHQVQRHNRGRSERDGNWRGGRGNFRGGRGRGGNDGGRGRGGRGGRGGNGGSGGSGNHTYRGPRRNEE